MNNDLFWVGITGPIGAGKSTLGVQLAMLLNLHTTKTVYIPLAREIKLITEKLVTLDTTYNRTIFLFRIFHDLYECSFEVATEAATRAVDYFNAYYTKDDKPRKFYQLLGTEIGRDLIGEDLWIRRVRANAKLSKANIVVSDDVRFENEAQAVDFLIKIDISNRDDYLENTKNLSANYTFTGHMSEQGVSVEPHAVIRCRPSDDEVLDLCERIENAYKNFEHRA